jgi:hypothetical protein
MPVDAFEEEGLFDRGDFGDFGDVAKRRGIRRIRHVERREWRRALARRLGVR